METFAERFPILVRIENKFKNSWCIFDFKSSLLCRYFLVEFFIQSDSNFPKIYNTHKNKNKKATEWIQNKATRTKKKTNQNKKTKARNSTRNFIFVQNCMGGINTHRTTWYPYYSKGSCIDNSSETKIYRKVIIMHKTWWWKPYLNIFWQFHTFALKCFWIINCKEKNNHNKAFRQKDI